MLTRMQEDTQDMAFKRLFARLIIVLVVIMAGLLWLTLQNGPRLRTVSLDRALLTTELGQRITLHANQPLAKIAPSSVHITPHADFTVTNTGDIVTISLKQRLKYDKHYTITINGVASKDSRRHISNFTHSFKTADPTFYYIKRSTVFGSKEQPDKIYKSTLHAAQDEPLYSAARILDYAILDKYLVVAAADSETTSTISLVDKLTGKVSPIDLPEPGLVGQLHASGDGTTYGFVFTSQSDRPSAYRSTLFMHDISPGHILVSVPGVAGKPVNVMDWQFAPDRTTIVAQLLDTSLLLIDGNFKHRPIPLGQYSSMSTFARDGTRLAVSNGRGQGVLDLLKRSYEPVPARLVRNSSTALLDIRLLSNQDGYLTYQQVPVGNADYREYLEYDVAGRTKTLYDTGQKDSTILEFGTSSNDQVLVVETAQLDSATYDNYPVAPRPLSTRTLLIDTDSGKTIRSIDGIDINWQ